MPPGRIWPGAAFAPPRAFVVPESPTRLLESASDRGVVGPGTADPAIMARGLCMSNRGYFFLRCHRIE
jgi:hypothetical protein